MRTERRWLAVVWVVCAGLAAGCPVRGPGPATCDGDTVEIDTYSWDVESCGMAEEASGADLSGEWTGVLTYEQTVGGETKSAEVEQTLDVRVFGAPIVHIPSLGLLGDWSTYGPSSGECNQDPSCLFAAGGVGTWYAFNGREVDGPANRLCFDAGAICATVASFEWQYEVTFVFVDLVDYGGYAYTERGLPLATLQGHEFLEVDDGTLVVDSSALGEDEDGTRLELRTSGVLVRP